MSRSQNLKHSQTFDIILPNLIHKSKKIITGFLPVVFYKKNTSFN